MICDHFVSPIIAIDGRLSGAGHNEKRNLLVSSCCASFSAFIAGLLPAEANGWSIVGNQRVCQSSSTEGNREQRESTDSETNSAAHQS